MKRNDFTRPGFGITFALCAFVALAPSSSLAEGGGSIDPIVVPPSVPVAVDNTKSLLDIASLLVECKEKLTPEELNTCRKLAASPAPTPDQVRAEQQQAEARATGVLFKAILGHNICKSSKELLTAWKTGHERASSGFFHIGETLKVTDTDEDYAKPELHACKEWKGKPAELTCCEDAYKVAQEKRLDMLQQESVVDAISTYSIGRNWGNRAACGGCAPRLAVCSRFLTEFMAGVRDGAKDECPGKKAKNWWSIAGQNRAPAEVTNGTSLTNTKTTKTVQDGITSSTDRKADGNAGGTENLAPAPQEAAK